MEQHFVIFDAALRNIIAGADNKWLYQTFLIINTKMKQ
jgi:hypothetical protein